MIINDTGIKQLIINGCIKGATVSLKEKGLISYGVSCFGYDLKLGDTIRIMQKTFGAIDPKDFKEVAFNEVKSNDHFIIPPFSFALSYSTEYFKMPRNLTGVVFPKSTYARCGLNCLQTVIEAGWEGQITLEFVNNTPNEIKMYVGEGCAQVLFFEGEPCAVSYADRKGKYQGQTGVTLPRIKRV